VLATLAAGGRGRSFVETEKRRSLAQRHAQRSRGLLASIERILAELFHVRDLWGRRHRDLLRVRLPRLGRPGGRFRD